MLGVVRRKAEAAEGHSLTVFLQAHVSMLQKLYHYRLTEWITSFQTLRKLYGESGDKLCYNCIMK